MTTEKQREVIRLWNQLRKLEGPAAEELRIQILECFSEQGGDKRADEIDFSLPLNPAKYHRLRGAIIGWSWGILKLGLSNYSGLATATRNPKPETISKNFIPIYKKTGFVRKNFILWITFFWKAMLLL